MTKVAIVTRTKDRPVFLRRALHSIAAQTFTDYVCVIVNDRGERLPIEAEIAGLPSDAQVRFTIVDNDQEIPRDGLINVGVKSTQSELVTVLDDDDSWAPTFLEEAVKFLAIHPEKGGVVSGSQIIFEEFNAAQFKETERVPISDWMRDLRLWQMLGRNLFPIHSFVYRREMGEKIGGYGDLSVLGDWDFNVRFMLESDLGDLRPFLGANYHQRVQTDASAAQNTALDEHRKQRIDMLEGVLARDPSLGRFMLMAASMSDLQVSVAELEQVIIPANRIALKMPGVGAPTPSQAPEGVAALYVAHKVAEGASLGVESLNERLREDIRAGTFGEGFWLNAMCGSKDLEARLKAVEDLARPIQSISMVPFRIKDFFTKG